MLLAVAMVDAKNDNNNNNNNKNANVKNSQALKNLSNANNLNTLSVASNAVSSGAASGLKPLPGSFQPNSGSLKQLVPLGATAAAAPAVQANTNLKPLGSAAAVQPVRSPSLHPPKSR